MNIPAVFRVLILSYLRHEKGRSLLTLFGISLGVAVLVAINLSNDSAVRSFRTTVDSVAGSATLTVRGNGVGVPGEIVPLLSRIEGVAAAAPLISNSVPFLIPGTDQRDSLLLLGVDLLFSEEFDDTLVRDLSFRTEEGRDFTSFLVDPHVGIFTEGFARRHGLGLGDRVQVFLRGAPREVTVGGLMEAGTLDRAQGGNVMVVDLGVADHWLQRSGFLDQIDIVTRNAEGTEQVARRLAEVLPPSLVVERPDARSERTEAMLAAFRFNLNALGHISLLVGAFLIYNTMSIAVVRRRTIIGTLRAMGIGARTIRLVFLAEGLMFGLLGGILGILLGILMAWLMIDAVSAAITINFFEAGGTRLYPSLGTILGAFLIGLLFSLVAALAPAIEASRTPPSNTMRRGSMEASMRPFGRFALVAGFVCMGLAGLLLLREPRPGIPILGYTSSALFIAGILFWGKSLLYLVTVCARPVLSRLARAEGLLAVASTQGALHRASTAVGGLVLGVAMTVSVAVMISSFRETVTTWMGQVLLADLYIRSESGNGFTPGDPIPPLLADAIAAIEGVESVDPFRSRPLLLNGQEARLAAGSFRNVRFANNSLDGESASDLMRRARENNEVIVSESFARKHRLSKGDTIRLPVPGGERSFPVAGIYYDYSSEQGYVVMDRALYLEIYDDPLIESIAVYTRPDADQREVRRAILAAADSTVGTPPLAVQLNTELREFALEAFDRTFGITYVLQLVAILVAVLGVATTLLSQILDRRHEMATLRFLGASRARVARIVVIESALIGVGGILPGLAVGVLLSWILTRVIMLESFGWTIAFAVPPVLLVQIGGVVFVATILSGLFPAREAVQETSRAMVVSG